MSNEIVIEAGGSRLNYWRDLLQFRELFWVLAWRDLSVRYRQTAIGVLWALIRPLLTMLVFTIVFSRIAGLPTPGDAPYALMVFVGMLPWMFFSTGLSEASDSLLNNEKLISKVYFPRMIVPIATIVVAFSEMLISLCMLIGLMAWYHFVPDWRICALPLFVFSVFAATLGPALWITAVNVKYRDFRYVIPFIVQLGIYISPVGFSSSIIPEKWRFLFSLNPIAGVIDGFRWSILRGQGEISILSMVGNIAVICLFLWLGVRRFRSMENTFADLI